MLSVYWTMPNLQLANEVRKRGVQPYKGGKAQLIRLRWIRFLEEDDEKKKMLQVVENGQASEIRYNERS